MTVPLPLDDPEQARLAHLGLSRVVEAGAWSVHGAVQRHGVATVWDAVQRGRALRGLSAELVAGASARAQGLDPRRDLEALHAAEGRLVVPGDDEWPGRLSWTREVKSAPPLSLQLRGPHPLADATGLSVAVVGARAATAYGTAVARELGCGLTDRGAAVVSGGAYGIDGAAHLGALASGVRPTVAVLACGVDVAYPRGHDRLLARIAAEGLLVSEVPPGTAPTRGRFLVRNRLIAGLSTGTVVVEAALRSGSLSTMGIAGTLQRPLMAVPGPVTSAMSAGCHEQIRGQARCVTSAAEVMELVSPMGTALLGPQRGAEQPRDALSEAERQLLEALPVRGGAGEAVLARESGLSTLVVQQVLPLLDLAGLVERGPVGWRLTPLGAGRPARR